MKKAAAIFLLSIFLFNTAGYYIVFKTAQYGIKLSIQNEIKAGSNSEKLETLVINKNNLAAIEWLESGKEMRYNNQLYDIVKSTETSTAITFYCINDTKEKSLYSKLEDHIKTHILSNVPVKNDSSKKLVDTVSKLYFSNDFSFSLIQNHSTLTYFISTLIYTPALLETNSPPPELV